MGRPAPPCAYPPCDSLAERDMVAVVQPELIRVPLCSAHVAIVRSNREDPGTGDFWRWFHAMSGVGG